MGWGDVLNDCDRLDWAAQEEEEEEEERGRMAEGEGEKEEKRGGREEGGRGWRGEGEEDGAEIRGRFICYLDSKAKTQACSRLPPLLHLASSKGLPWGIHGGGGGLVKLRT